MPIPSRDRELRGPGGLLRSRPVANPRKNVPIAEWQDGDRVQGFAFLAAKERRQDRSGNDYLHLELRDATGQIPAKAWSGSQALDGEFEANDFIAFEGSVQSYRDRLQLVVRKCRRAREEDREYGFDEGTLVPSTREDLDDLWERLTDLLGREIRHPALVSLVEETLAAHGEALREHPAAKSIHHAYRGGLLEHVVSMLELAVAVCDHYRRVNRELVLLGVLYHDLGKLLELGAMPANDYTPAGRLVGHVVQGRDLLRDACRAVEEVPGDLQLHLEHLILSHQGRKEWGSPVEPMTREALVLHFLDNLDSKLAQLRQAQRQREGFHYLRPLGRFVYLERQEEESPTEATSEVDPDVDREAPEGGRHDDEEPEELDDLPLAPTLFSD